MSTLERRIRTRCFEALLSETRKCFDRDIDVATPSGPQTLRALYSSDRQQKIFGFPIKIGESVVPRQINIVPAPMNFHQGIGGISDSLYDFEINFIFPTNVIYYDAGEGHNTYLDEIDELRVWLFGGGSVANRNGRLQDPDNPGSVINLSITRWDEQRWSLAPNNAGIEVPIVVGFGTRENSTGVRV